MSARCAPYLQREEVAMLETRINEARTSLGLLSIVGMFVCKGEDKLYSSSPSSDPVMMMGSSGWKLTQETFWAWPSRV